MKDHLKYLQSNWKKIGEGMPAVDFKKGQTLFYEGHFPNGVFVILSGDLGFVKGDFCKTDEQHSFTIPQGKVVGLSQIVNNVPSCCSCVAATDCKTLFISKTVFDPVEGKTKKENPQK